MIKKQGSGFLPAMMAPIAGSLIAPMPSSLIQPIASSLINSINRKGQEGEFLSLLELPLMMKSIGKRSRRAERGYMNKIF